MLKHSRTQQNREEHRATLIAIRSRAVRGKKRAVFAFLSFIVEEEGNYGQKEQLQIGMATCILIVRYFVSFLLCLTFPPLLIVWFMTVFVWPWNGERLSFIASDNADMSRSVRNRYTELKPLEQTR